MGGLGTRVGDWGPGWGNGDPGGVLGTQVGGLGTLDWEPGWEIVDLGGATLGPGRGDPHGGNGNLVGGPGIR